MRIDIMGCPLDAITQDETVERIFEWRDAPVRTSHHVVTMDVPILMMMRSDPKLAQAVQRADLVVTDGNPLVWTSRWMRSPVPEKVSGVKLMQRLLEVGAVRGLSVYLLGGTDERLAALQRLIFEEYPTVRVAGARNGFFGPSQDWKVVRTIREARADVLLVGMPAPFEDIWCEDHKDRLATPAIVGVGRAFDLLAGGARRAPRKGNKIMRSAALEWAWRLATEPRRLWKRRLVSNATFLARLPKAIAQSRLPSPFRAPRPG
jgi:N-acetylglucosaminyldiphosphoundecaprenol N-acetyl-beta-D-mannosaminyltransferase